MSSAPSLETLVMGALRGAAEPLSTEQLLRHVPAPVLAEQRNLQQKLRTILGRPEVGRAARGRYVYLPHRLTGSVLRLPLAGAEAGAGTLLVPADLTFALWFRQVDWGRVATGAAATWLLPNGTTGRLSVREVLRNRLGLFGGVTLAAAGPELHAWLRAERPAAGDSLLARITDGEQSLCSVTLERLSARQPEPVAARSRELADAAAHVLRNDVRGSPLFAHDLCGWLLAAGFYHQLPPPDPLEVLLRGDARFTLTEDGKFMLAMKWDWTRRREPEIPPAMIEDFIGELLGRPKRAATDADDARDPRRYGADLLEELQPWLQAVGYPVAQPGEPPAPHETAAADAQTALRRQQVYRLRAALARRPADHRILELQGDDTLVDLDELLREAFGHDVMDHMGGFYVRTGRGERPEWLAAINPLGELEEGEEYELAELHLEPGDQWGYVYDFGDWIEHTLTVEAVVPVEPGVTYPRLVERGPAPVKRKK